jgi:hypothetical protein
MTNHTYEPQIRQALLDIVGYARNSKYDDKYGHDAKQLESKKEDSLLALHLDWNLGTDHDKDKKTRKFMDAFSGSNFLVEVVGKSERFSDFAKGFRFQIPDTLDSITKLNSILREMVLKDVKADLDTAFSRASITIERSLSPAQAKQARAELGEYIATAGDKAKSRTR